MKYLQNWNFKENAFDRLEMTYHEIFKNSGIVSFNSSDKTDHRFIDTFLLVIMCLLLLITFAIITKNAQNIGQKTKQFNVLLPLLSLLKMLKI